MDKRSLLTLDQLKQEHKKRHHPSSVSECASFLLSQYDWIFIDLTSVNASRWQLKAVPGSTCLAPLLLKTPWLSHRVAWQWISNGAMWKVYLRHRPCPLQQHWWAPVIHTQNIFLLYHIYLLFICIKLNFNLILPLRKPNKVVHFVYLPCLSLFTCRISKLPVGTWGVQCSRCTGS